MNVDYVYLCPNKSKQTLVILGVQTPSKAERLLKENGIEVI